MPCQYCGKYDTARALIAPVNHAHSSSINSGNSTGERLAGAGQAGMLSASSTVAYSNSAFVPGSARLKSQVTDLNFQQYPAQNGSQGKSSVMSLLVLKERFR